MGYPMRGYRPNRFRPNSGRGPGSQGAPDSSAPWFPGNGKQPPVPANDNLPTAANDNTPPAVDFPLAPAVDIAGALAPRGLARFIPYVGWALLAYEAGRFISNLQLSNYALQVIGYTLILDCGKAPITMAHQNAFTSCGSGVIPNYPDLDNFPPIFVYFWDTSNAASWGANFKTADAAQRYQRIGSNTLLARKHVTGHWAATVSPSQFPYPSVAPETTPIMQPIPTPLPPPYTAVPDYTPHPGLPQSQQWQMGPSPSLSGRTRARAWDLTAGRSTTPKHRMRRPKKNTKEQKFKMNVGSAYTVRNVFDFMTEADDAVDAIYWSVKLPKGKKRPFRKFYKDAFGKWRREELTIQQKAKFIYDNAEHISMSKALENLAKNELKDRFYGKIGKTAGQAAQAVHDAGIGSPSKAPQLSRFGVSGR